MNQYILKISGKASDVVKQLKTINAIFGKGTTLSDVAVVARYTRVIQAEKEQFKKDGKTI